MMIVSGDFNIVENPRLDRQPPVDDSNHTEGNVNLNSFFKETTSTSSPQSFLKIHPLGLKKKFLKLWVISGDLHAKYQENFSFVFFSIGKIF